MKITITAEELAKRFDISLSAAKIRASEIARVGRRKTGELRPLPSGVAEFLRNQKKKGFQVKSVDLD